MPSIWHGSPCTWIEWCFWPWDRWWLDTRCPYKISRFGCNMWAELKVTHSHAYSSWDICWCHGNPNEVRLIDWLLSICIYDINATVSCIVSCYRHCNITGICAWLSTMLLHACALALLSSHVAQSINFYIYVPSLARLIEWLHWRRTCMCPLCLPR